MAYSGKAVCPRCKTKIRFEDAAAGDPLTCTACTHEFSVPAPPPPPVVVPAPAEPEDSPDDMRGCTLVTLGMLLGGAAGIGMVTRCGAMRARALWLSTRITPSPR